MRNSSKSTLWHLLIGTIIIAVIGVGGWLATDTKTVATAATMAATTSFCNPTKVMRVFANRAEVSRFRNRSLESTAYLDLKGVAEKLGGVFFMVGLTCE